MTPLEIEVWPQFSLFRDDNGDCGDDDSEGNDAHAPLAEKISDYLQALSDRFHHGRNRIRLPSLE